jgi:hypothetical protein
VHMAVVHIQWLRLLLPPTPHMPGQQGTYNSKQQAAGILMQRSVATGSKRCRLPVQLEEA